MPPLAGCPHPFERRQQIYLLIRWRRIVRPRQVQQPADQALQPLGIVCDAREEAATLLLRHGVHVLAQKFRRTLNCGQRRLELMGYMRREAPDVFRALLKRAGHAGKAL